jgi:ribosomal protein L11 methyltransferase
MIELSIQQVKSADIEALSDLLEQCGALAITLTDAANQPILEPPPGETPLWSDIQLQVLFDEQADTYLLCQTLIKTTYPDCVFSIKPIEERPWELEWEKNSKPLCFGKRLWVCPSHLSPPSAQAITVTLDPGLAFGTGTHPTTALCLRWLDQQDLSNQVIIDYGCGSGILMISALKLGARFAYGIDLDPQAITASQDNAEKNHISPEQYQLGLSAEIADQPADVLLANILLNPLLTLKQEFVNRLKPDGILVLSGILSEQAPVLVAAYQSHFQLVASDVEEEWGLLVLRRLGED